jgi:hypothetical protein
MTRVQDFVADLVRAVQGFTEIKTVVAAYGDWSLSNSQIYKIIKDAKARKTPMISAIATRRRLFALRTSSPL